LCLLDSFICLIVLAAKYRNVFCILLCKCLMAVILTKVGSSIIMQNQDTVFQQVWSVCMHLTSQFLQNLTVVGCSYSRTTRYPVCHDHTFTIVCENHHLFHVRLDLLEFFQSRGALASPLTGLRFQFRLEIPDPGFVNSNHILQKFVPFFTKSVQQLCNFQTSTLVPN